MKALKDWQDDVKLERMAEFNNDIRERLAARLPIEYSDIIENWDVVLSKHHIAIKLAEHWLDKAIETPPVPGDQIDPNILKSQELAILTWIFFQKIKVPSPFPRLLLKSNRKFFHLVLKATSIWKENPNINFDLINTLVEKSEGYYETYGQIAYLLINTPSENQSVPLIQKWKYTALPSHEVMSLLETFLTHQLTRLPALRILDNNIYWKSKNPTDLKKLLRLAYQTKCDRETIVCRAQFGIPPNKPDQKNNNAYEIGALLNNNKIQSAHSIFMREEAPEDLPKGFVEQLLETLEQTNNRKGQKKLFSILPKNGDFDEWVTLAVQDFNGHQHKTVDKWYDRLIAPKSPENILRYLSGTCSALLSLPRFSHHEVVDGLINWIKSKLLNHPNYQSYAQAMLIRLYHHRGDHEKGREVFDLFQTACPPNTWKDPLLYRSAGSYCEILIQQADWKTLFGFISTLEKDNVLFQFQKYCSDDRILYYSEMAKVHLIPETTDRVIWERWCNRWERILRYPLSNSELGLVLQHFETQQLKINQNTLISDFDIQNRIIDTALQIERHAKSIIQNELDRGGIDSQRQLKRLDRPGISHLIPFFNRLTFN